MGRAVARDRIMQIEQAYVLWSKHRNDAEVGRLMNIPSPTIARWRKVHRWEDRIGKITASVSAKIDSAVESAHEKMAARITEAFNEAMDEFGEAPGVSKLEIAKATGELVRNYQLLMGEATSRPETMERKEVLDIAKLQELFAKSAKEPMVVEEDHTPILENTQYIAETLKKKGVALSEEYVEEEIPEERDVV